MSDPTSSDSAKSCPQCGVPLAADAPNGLCPACLMAEVMQPAAPGDAVTMPVSRPAPSQPRNEAPDLPLPEELTGLLPHGMYKVDGFLGQGGMGAVYKGTQVRLKRPVAIKIMRRDFGKDYDFEARFEREAQAMAKLNHPNIVSVIDYGEAGTDYLYIVMELVDGADMMDVIRTGRMTQEMALTLLPQICDALQFAHDHGIVHRDIKPSNIMLTRDGRIKMADFGLAKRFDAESSFRTQTGTGMGTPDYAAPEQFDAHAPIDHRADIYALGVMIYQMITGQLPRGVWKPPSQRAEINPQWDDIVSRAMQSDPKDRYQQASEVKTDVSQITPQGRAAGPSAAAQGGAAGPPAAGNGPTSANPGKAPAKPNAALAGASALPKAKSRAALAIGTVVIGLIAFAAVMFATRGKQSSAGLKPAPAPTTPSALKSTEAPTTPAAKATGDGLKPGTTLAAATAAPLAAPALPESGWKPLITATTTPPHLPGKREWSDRRLHLLLNAVNTETPHADGALRARIQFQNGSRAVGLVARSKITGESYKLNVLDQGSVSLNVIGAKGQRLETLGRHAFPKPLAAGDLVTLELRVHGDRLTGLVNGTAVIEARDTRYPDAGTWGIVADDGWFETAEVQMLPAVGQAPRLPSPPAGGAPALQNSTDEPWRDWIADKRAEQKLAGFGFEDDGTFIRNPNPVGAASWKPVIGDGAIRATWRLPNDAFTPGKDEPSLSLRKGGLGEGSINATYMAVIAAKEIRLDLHSWDASNKVERRELGRWPLPAGFDRTQEHTFELRAVGDVLTVRLNGQPIGTVRDSAVAKGGFGFFPAKGASIRKMEFLRLDPASAASASPNLPVSKSSEPKFPPGQWVKLFTKPEDLPADLRKPDSGVTWEEGWLHLENRRTKAIELPAQLKGSYGVRLRARHDGKQPPSAPGIVLRGQVKADGKLDGAYAAKYDGAALFCARSELGKWATLYRENPRPALTQGQEYTLEFAAVGERLIGRLARISHTAIDFAVRRRGDRL